MFSKKSTTLCLLGVLVASSSLVALEVVGQENAAKVEEIAVELPLVEDVGEEVAILPATDYSDDELYDVDEGAEIVESVEADVSTITEMSDADSDIDSVSQMDVSQDIESHENREAVVVTNPSSLPVDKVVSDESDVVKSEVGILSEDEAENATFSQDYAVSDRISPEYIEKNEAESLKKIQDAYDKRILAIEAEYKKAIAEIGEVDMSVLADVDVAFDDLPVVVDGSKVDQAEKKPIVTPKKSAFDVSQISDVKEVLARIPAGALSSNEDALTVKKDVAMDRSGGAHGGVLPEIKVEDMDPNYRTDKGIMVVDAAKGEPNESEDLFRDLKIAHKALEEEDTETAIAYFKRAANRDPKFETRFGLATAYHMDGQEENAKKMYLELIAENNNDWRVLNNLLLLAGSRADMETLQELNKLEHFNSEFPAIPAHMGMLYTERGEYDKAAKKFLRAIELEPGNVRYRYNLALVMEKLGNVANAVKIYQQLLFAGRRGQELPVPYNELQGRVEHLAASMLFNK